MNKGASYALSAAVTDGEAVLKRLLVEWAKIRFMR
jgi:hypothetical protein